MYSLTINENTMDIFFTSIGMVSAGLIAWQDFKDREIHIAYLIAFSLAGIALFFYQKGWESLMQLIPSILMVSLLLLFLVLLTKIWCGKPVMDRQLGWGDVFMLYGLACWWETYYFLIFYTLSSCLLAFIFLILQKQGKVSKGYPIPLAGIWAGAFLLFFPFPQMYPIETFIS